MDRFEITNKLLEEMKLRGFSRKTKNIYLYNVNNFFKWIEKSSQNMSKDAVRKYFFAYLDTKIFS